MFNFPKKGICPFSPVVGRRALKPCVNFTQRHINAIAKLMCKIICRLERQNICQAGNFWPWSFFFFGLPTTVSRASPRLICWSTRVAHLAWWVSLPTGIFCIHKRSNPRAPQTCLSDTKLLTTWTNPRWYDCSLSLDQNTN